MESKNIFIGIAVLVILVIGIVALSNGDSSENNSPGTGDVISENPELGGDSDKVTVYFFWGEGCPHCANEKPFLESLEKEYGDEIEVKMFETYQDQDNVKLFQEVASAYGIQARGVPATFIGEKHWVGFSEPMSSEMESYIEECIENKCESPLE